MKSLRLPYFRISKKVRKNPVDDAIAITAKSIQSNPSARMDDAAINELGYKYLTKIN
jgi:hypothetical protein